MRDLVLIHGVNAVLGGISLALGPVSAAIWALVNVIFVAPLIRGAKSRLPAGINRATVDAVGDTAFYTKMGATGNAATILSIGLVIPVLRWENRAGAGPQVDRVTWAAALGMLVALVAVGGWPLLFPLVTYSWVYLLSRYEWASAPGQARYVAAGLKMAGAAMFSTSLAGDLRNPAFVVECLLVTLAMQSYGPRPEERLKNYAALLPALPMVLLDWRWWEHTPGDPFPEQLFWRWVLYQLGI